MIEEVREKEFLGEKRKYLVLRVAYGDLTLLVPVDSTDQVGLRQVVSKNEVKKVLKVLTEDESSMAANWSRRFKNNMEKLHSGDPYQVAEVLRNLAIREREKGLSAGEKRMIPKARQILISELAFATAKTEDEAETMIDEVLDGAHGVKVPAAGRSRPDPLGLQVRPRAYPWSPVEGTPLRRMGRHGRSRRPRCPLRGRLVEGVRLIFIALFATGGFQSAGPTNANERDRSCTSSWEPPPATCSAACSDGSRSTRSPAWSRSSAADRPPSSPAASSG